MTNFMTAMKKGESNIRTDAYERNSAPYQRRFSDILDSLRTEVTDPIDKLIVNKLVSSSFPSPALAKEFIDTYVVEKPTDYSVTQDDLLDLSVDNSILNTINDIIEYVKSQDRTDYDLNNPTTSIVYNTKYLPSITPEGNNKYTVLTYAWIVKNISL